MQLADLFNLHGKVAVVTGGAFGIGAGIVERLAEMGAAVVVVDTDGAAAAKVAAAHTREGRIARSFGCDVSQLAQIDQVIDSVVKDLGHVDVLVNNAGVFPVSPALETSEKTWDRVVDTNLKGAFFFSQAAARHMVRRGEGGAIVNIASIDAFHPSGRLVHYDASKGGLVMMTKSLAFELGTAGIRVNAIAPGAIHTPGADAAMKTMGGEAGAKAVQDAFVKRIPLARMGEPDDIATATAFLVSRAASYVTGSTLIVDGGFLLA